MPLKCACTLTTLLLMFPSMASSQSGQWQFVDSKDKMTDKKQDYIERSSEDTYATAAGDQAHARLVISCVRSEQRIVSAVFDGSVLTGYMRMRYDDEKDRSSYWALAQNQKGFFFQGADKIVGQMSTHQKLLLEVTSYPGVKQVVTFNLVGLSEILGTHDCPAPAKH